jgi:F-type H+-transporting ATPase subunit epsilon
VAVEVHLVTPEREVFVGEVAMVVAHGVDGDVGILAGHAPLLVQLTVGPLRMQREDGTWEAAVVDGGFLHVSNDEGVTRADVLAADAQLAGEIDVEAARRRLDELSEASGDDAEAQAEIARATARVTLAG